MRVGILGGGQFGRMLALAGHALGVRCRVFDPAVDACAGQVAEHFVGAFDDGEALRRFAQGLDAVTYTQERVPVEAVRFLSGLVAVYPSAGALETAQDRFLEKAVFRKLGIATAPFAAVESREELDTAVRVVGLPAVLKTRRLGYDGKGQAVIRRESEADDAWRSLPRVPMILEGFVPFQRELSVIAVRGVRGRPPANVTPYRAPRGGPGPSRVTRPPGWLPPAAAGERQELDQEWPPRASERQTPGPGESAFYPVVENVHRDGLLRRSRAPAPGLAPYLQSEAEDLAGAVLDALQFVGVLAVELFEQDGRLLANEVTPRVHNSGHWTIEGAETSQFENHLRAVCGLPLGSAEPRGQSAMVNLIGSAPPAERLLAIPGAHVHMYGKEPRPGRKIGHVTLRANDSAAIESSLSLIERLIENQEG